MPRPRTNGPWEDFFAELLRPLWDRRYTKQGPVLLLVLVACPCFVVRGCYLKAEALYASTFGDGVVDTHNGATEATPTVARASTFTDEQNADAHASVCGSLQAHPRARELTDWTRYECATRSEAGDRWSACLRRVRYSNTSGAGCGERERCCPPL